MKASLWGLKRLSAFCKRASCSSEARAKHLEAVNWSSWAEKQDLTASAQDGRLKTFLLFSVRLLWFVCKTSHCNSLLPHCLPLSCSLLSGEELSLNCFYLKGGGLFLHVVYTASESGPSFPNFLLQYFSSCKWVTCIFPSAWLCEQIMQIQLELCDGSCKNCGLAISSRRWNNSAALMIWGCPRLNCDDRGQCPKMR